MKKKLWLAWSALLWLVMLPSVLVGQQKINPNLQIQTEVPIEGQWLMAQVNKRFFADGFPSSCTVSSVAYTTQLDCAVATANAWIAANSAGAVLVLGAGTYNTCAGVAMYENSSNYFTLSILGAGQEQSIISQSCSLASGKYVLSHGDNAGLGRALLINFRINANNNADGCMKLFGIEQSVIENINCSQPRGSTGAFDIEATTNYYAWGDASGAGTAGSFFQNFVKNVTATGYGLPTSMATGTATIVSGAITGITITAGGGGYVSGEVYAFIGGYGNLDAAHSWFPQPCITMPSVITVTVSGGAVTAATPTNDSAFCSGTATGVTFFNLPPINYAFYLQDATDNTFYDLNCGSANRNACIFNGAANNTFIHAHPNGGVFGVLDFGRALWVGTEFDSIIANSALLESASRFYGTTFTWNQAAGNNYYSNSDGYFFNGSIGSTLGAPGAISGATVEATGRCDQSFDNVPTGYNDYWDQSGPFGTSVPSGVSIIGSNPCSTATGTKQTVMGESFFVNAQNTWKGAVGQPNYNSWSIDFRNSYYNFGKDDWTMQTASDTTAGALPAYEEFDFLNTGAQTPLGSLAGTVPYVYGFGYSGAAGQATSSANVDSPWLVNKASWWSGAAQFISCGPHVHPVAGTSQPIQIDFGCTSTGSPGEIQWQFQGGRIQLFNGTWTASLKADNLTSSNTYQFGTSGGTLASLQNFGCSTPPTGTMNNTTFLRGDCTYQVGTVVGVSALNSTTGSFTFTGSGVSQSGNTFTFTSSAAAAGSNQNVQFNNSGVFGADSQININSSTHVFSAPQVVLGSSSNQDASVAAAQASNLATVRQHSNISAFDYLYTDSVHGGTDICEALNYIDQNVLASGSITDIDLGSSANQLCYTEAKITHSAQVSSMQGGNIVAQSSLSSAVDAITGISGTLGSTSITFSSGALAANARIYSPAGIPAGDYVVSVSGSTATLALPLSLGANAMTVSGSTSVCGLSNTAGINTTLGVAGIGIPAATTVSAVNYVTRCITISNMATMTSTSPIWLNFSGTITTAAYASVPETVLTFLNGSGCVENAENHCIYSGAHDLTIADLSNSGVGRTLNTQGIQAIGEDRFYLHNVNVYNLIGACLILGGNPGTNTTSSYSVRESNVSDSSGTDCGDPLTGQYNLEDMTPALSTGDENNTNKFSNIDFALSYAGNILVGTYNPANFGGPNGPRIEAFTNIQREAGGHLPSTRITPPFPLVELQNAEDISFFGGNLNAPGYGKALYDVVWARGITDVGVSRRSDTSQKVYQVTVTSGGSTATYTGGGAGGFAATYYFNDIGIVLAQPVNCWATSSCTSFDYVYTKPGINASTGVFDPSTTSTVMSFATGTSITLTGAADLVVATGGFFFNNQNYNSTGLTAKGGLWSPAETDTLTLLGYAGTPLTTAETIITGMGFLNPEYDYNGTNVGTNFGTTVGMPPSYTTGGSTITQPSTSGTLALTSGVPAAITFPSGVLAGAGSTAAPTVATSPQVVTALNASPSSVLATALLPAATSGALGTVKADNSTLTNTSGTLSCTTATASQLGCSKPDNSTITAAAGVLTALGATSGAQVFNSAGSFTFTTSSHTTILLIFGRAGAGGGGGGGCGGGGSTVAGAAGSSSGSPGFPVASTMQVVPVSVSTSYTVTVGAGGTAGTACATATAANAAGSTGGNGGTGGNGANSTFDVLATWYGGGGGVAGAGGSLTTAGAGASANTAGGRGVSSAASGSGGTANNAGGTGTNPQPPSPGGQRVAGGTGGTAGGAGGGGGAGGPGGVGSADGPNSGVQGAPGNGGTTGNNGGNGTAPTGTQTLGNAGLGGGGGGGGGLLSVTGTQGGIGAVGTAGSPGMMNVIPLN